MILVLVPKILAFSCCLAVINVLIAQTDTNTTTGTLALVGTITLVSTAVIGAYGRWREVRSEADKKDLRVHCEGLEAELKRCRLEVEEWKALYAAVSQRSSRQRSESK
jgi:hypothetical protein